MKTNKRDKGIKGKPTQDINTCNEYYKIIRLRSYLGSINFVQTTIYLGKSYKKAYKYLKLDKKQQLKTCSFKELEYRAQKIVVKETNKKVLIKIYDVWEVRKESDIKEAEKKYPYLP